MSVFKGMADELTRAGQTGAAKIYTDFENGVGTYVKVVRFSEPPNPDGFVVLYLRSTGLFLLLGYWRGYERSVVAGQWSKLDDFISLEGHGEASTDAPPSQAGLFQRTLRADMQNQTPVLIGASELTGWSLLGWTGPFTYIGQATIINPDGKWLPQSFDEIDGWIHRLIAA